MTSSYNLSRRSEKELFSPTAWGVQQKQGGICPPDHITVPIKTKGGGCSDWKFCVPIKSCDPSCHSKRIVEKRLFTHDLYNQGKKHISQSPMNHYPICSRMPERRGLDKEDYYRLPVKFDGTGYFDDRTWDKFPEHATDQIDLPKIWSPFQMIQRHELKEHVKQGLKERERLGLKPNQQPYFGTFYYR